MSAVVTRRSERRRRVYSVVVPAFYDDVQIAWRLRAEFEMQLMLSAAPLGSLKREADIDYFNMTLEALAASE